MPHSTTSLPAVASGRAAEQARMRWTGNGADGGSVKRLRLLSRKQPERLLDDNDRVVRDVLCIQCGVNLISLPVEENCPNCLHPVSDSVHGDYLIHADPSRVRRLAEAARFVRFGALFLGGMILLGLLVTFTTELMHRDFIRGVNSVFQLIFAGAMMAPLVAAIGLATLTNRRSFAWFQASYGNQKSITRGVLLLIGAVGVIGTGFSIAPSLTRIALLVGWATIPVALFMLKLSQLMRRVPNAELSAMAKVAMWGVIASGVALLCVQYLSSQSGGKQLNDTYVAMASLYIVVAVAFGIGAYRLLARVEGVLSKTAR